MAKGSWREFDDPFTYVRPIAISKNDKNSQRQIGIQKTRAGKGGKTVTTITGLDMEINQAKAFLKQIKSLCGTGGRLKGDSIELQGDQVKIIFEVLEKKGYQPKKIGG